MTILLLAAASAAAQPVPAPPSTPLKWGAHLDLEGKLGNNRDLGEADFFLPLLQNGTSLLFGNVKARTDDNAGREGNFGLGARHMLDAGWNLGAYGYYDRRRTETHNFFSQATFGVEALSLDWDLRANAYLPVGRRSHDLGSSSGGASTAAVSGTTVTITTPGASVREERSLQGFDAEIGWRVPVFARTGDMQLRLYGGAYRFYADEVDPVQGPRARAELTVDEVPGLWRGSRLALGGEIQNDGPRGKTGFATARLRIPLQLFGATEPARLTPIERRMTDPVVRDIDVVAQSRTVSTPSVTETATQVSGGQTLTVFDSGSTTGAALPGAVAGTAINSTILLTGTFNTTATVVLQTGQTLRGGGSFTVQSASGRTATLTTSAATIAGTVSAGTAAAVSMATNSTLTGLTITNTHAVAGTAVNGVVALGGITGATVSSNTITTTATANSFSLALSATDATTLTISSNTLTANGVATQTAAALNLSATNAISATVSGNTLSASGATTNNHSRLLEPSNTVTILTGSTGNTVSAGTCNAVASGGGTIAYTNAANCP